jgi:SAM-dependent methyltransferase
MPGSTADGYDALASEYARHLADELDRKPFDRAFLERFVAMAPDGGILDVGCGPGQVGRFVHALGREVSGVDISPNMVACARELSPDLSFEVGDMRALPFPSASFAGLLAFYSIIHLDAGELPGVFAEMKRLLMPGGVLALAFHVGREVRHVEELWGVKTCLDFIFFEPEEIVDALQAAGFAIVEKTLREPYDPAVEAQTNRCYILARVATQ